jgi:hypothetical protein
MRRCKNNFREDILMFIYVRCQFQEMLPISVRQQTYRTKKKKNRWPTVLTADKLGDVHVFLQRSPSKCLRKHHLHTYCIGAVQELKCPDTLMYTKWVGIAGYGHLKKQYAFLEKPLHPQKISVQCALSTRCLVGPILLEATVDIEVFQHIITHLMSMLGDNKQH